MKFVNAILFSNFWISIGAVCTTLFYYKIASEKINYFYLTIVFFATLFAYNLQYISENKTNKHRKIQTKWIEENHIFLKYVTTLSLILSVILSFLILPINSLFLSIPFLLVVVFYKKRKLNNFALRNIPILKIILIALCWMFACTVMPSIIAQKPIVWRAVIYVFFYVVSITLPFDIRDYFVDDKSLLSIPHLIGVKLTYVVSIIILCFLILIIFFNLSLMFFLLFTALLVVLSYKITSEYYYLIILDGLLIILPIFV